MEPGLGVVGKVRVVGGNGVDLSDGVGRGRSVRTEGLYSVQSVLGVSLVFCSPRKRGEHENCSFN